MMQPSVSSGTKVDGIAGASAAARNITPARLPSGSWETRMASAPVAAQHSASLPAPPFCDRSLQNIPGFAAQTVVAATVSSVVLHRATTPLRHYSLRSRSRRNRRNHVTCVKNCGSSFWRDLHAVSDFALARSGCASALRAGPCTNDSPVPRPPDSWIGSTAVENA